MISHAWAEVVVSDRAVPKGEWAGVRPSTAAERRIVQADRKSISNTFLISGCGGFVRLIVAGDTPRRSILHDLSLDRKIWAAVQKQAPAVPDPYSASVLATAFALVPEALDEFRQVAINRRCATCDCVMREAGPLNSNSETGAFIAHQIAGSSKAKEIHHGA